MLERRNQNKMQLTPDSSNQLDFLFILILPSVTRTLDN